MFIPAQIRARVIQRAGNRCEYCGIHQRGQEAAFHIDHIIPVTAAGTSDLANLALACVSCSLRKGARQTGIDPHTGKSAPLFNPRRHSWRLHFRWHGVIAVGLSPIGRATVAALSINRPNARNIREQETRLGRHPPAQHL